MGGIFSDEPNFNAVPTSGGSFTGPVYGPGKPNHNYEFVNKKYIDEGFTVASKNDDLSDLAHQRNTTDQDSTTMVIAEVSEGNKHEGGWLMCGSVSGFNISEVRLIVDGTSNVLAYGTARYDAHDGGAIHHVDLPPVYFHKSLKVEVDTGSSTTRVGGQAWIHTWQARKQVY